MNVKYLQWDSDFFDMRIGRVDVYERNDIKTLYEQKNDLQEKYDLLYVFCPYNLDWQNDQFVLADNKVIYSKNIFNSISFSAVSIFEDTIPTTDLYKLALISGKYSRYKLDPHWPQGSYERLYRRWIEQSVNHNMADAVFVHRSDNSVIDGMLTMRYGQDEAEIGLVAVDDNIQNKGIGSQLMTTAENYLALNTDVKVLRVATQLTNTVACHWYEKHDFQIESITRIYHWWLKS